MGAEPTRRRDSPGTGHALGGGPVPRIWRNALTSTLTVSSAATAPPALVLGSGLTVIGVVRALGRAGIPLHVLSEEPGPARASRWYRPPPHGRFLSEGAPLEAYLQSLPIERGVLIPASDEAVLSAAALPTDLRERFPASQATAPVLCDFIHKDRLRLLLERLDIPHPRTLKVERPEDVDALTDEQVAHVFIKPADSQSFFRRYRVKAIRPRGRADLRAHLERLRREGHAVVLQEYVPGPPRNHCFLDGFVDRAGRFRALLARRRLRMSPPLFGSSCATVSVPVAEVARAFEDLERLFAAVDYRGMFDAEFKQDERTGAFRLIEVNVRAWWQVEFAAMCGVDVVTMAYKDALDLPFESAERYRLGLQWILPYEDFSAYKALWKSGDATLAQWTRSWVNARWAGFALDDPLPGFAGTGERIRTYAGRRLRRSAGGRPAPLP